MADGLGAKNRPHHGPIYLGIAFEGGLILVAWLLGWLLGHKPLDSLHWSVSGFLLGPVATLPMLAAFFLLLQSRLRSIVRIRRLFDEIALSFFGPYTWFDLAFLSLLACIHQDTLSQRLAQSP